MPFVIEIEWQNILLTYNGEVQKPAAIAVNLIGGDACGLTVGGGAKDAGTYTARVIGIDNGNYALPANVTVVYTIQPLTACLEWDNLAFTYNGSLQKPSARVANLLEGDTCGSYGFGSNRLCGRLYGNGGGFKQFKLRPARKKAAVWLL